MVTPLVVSEMVTVCGVAYVPDPGEKFGVFAEIVYGAVEVLLCEIPAPAAIALIVVVVEIAKFNFGVGGDLNRFVI